MPNYADFQWCCSGLTLISHPPFFVPPNFPEIRMHQADENRSHLLVDLEATGEITRQLLLAEAQGSFSGGQQYR